MSEHTAQRDYERAVALRQATFELVWQHTRCGPQASDPDVITCLQDAANRLGTAERALLKKLADSRNVHRAATSEKPPVTSNGAPPNLPVSREAAIILALAETLVPLAPSREDEAERWLRIMREHGNVGNGLEELGMASRELSTPSLEPRQLDSTRDDPVTPVAEDAARFARERGAPLISTVELLFAVILHYGRLFDRALYRATRKTRSELLTALNQLEPVAQLRD